MRQLSRLLDRLQQLTRQHVAIEAEIADMQKQILQAGETAKPKRGRPRGTSRGVSEGVNDTVRVLREAGEALSRQEIARRLNVAGSAVGFRLVQAVKLGFVEKIGHGRYQCAASVKGL